MLHILDLHFKSDQTIASFLIETTAGPVLIETGPYSTYETLCKELKKYHYEPTDIQYVLLTHIHFDHAGAAWAFAEAGATIYVHPIGLPHLHAPEKLYQSAKRIYGDQMEALWGEMRPIASDKLRTAAHKEHIVIGRTTFTALHTPGHASHHIAWEMDKVIFTGDVAGVVIGAHNPVLAPCPPPDIHLESWNNSLTLLENREAESFYLTHFGKVSHIRQHVQELRYMLHDWAMWVKPHWEKGRKPAAVVPEFQAYTMGQLRAAGLDEDMIARYEAANPAWMSVAGLMRYWRKRQELEESLKNQSL